MPGLIVTAVLTGIAFLQTPPGGAEGEGVRPAGSGSENSRSLGVLDLSDRPAIREPRRHDRRPDARTPERVAAASSDCSPFFEQIRTTSGDALVGVLLKADIYCIAELEWIGDQPEVQYAASKEEHTVHVARAIPGLMASYGDSTRSKEDIYRLFLFLDMARDISHWCRDRQTCEGTVWRSADVYSVEVGSAAGNAVKGAFDAYMTHPDFMSRDDGHADTMYWILSILGRFPLPEHYLDVTTKWLGAWDEDYASSELWGWAMQAVLDIPYSCHRRVSACRPAYGSDVDLFNALRDFTVDGNWLGSSSQRILELTTVELGRFGLYPGTSNYERLPVAVRAVRDRYASGTATPEARSSIWLRLVASLDYNDSRNCDRYGLCDWYAGAGFNARFQRELFTGTRVCSQNACAGDTVTVHAQGLSADELDVACRRLTAHSHTFESMFNTQCRPVQGDPNAHLDLFVFSDGASCEDLESAAFGGHPDSCSGIFWEGDGSIPGSVTVTTEKERGDPYIDPELAIWNFEHEYAHHLDGRYNRHGPFTGDPMIAGWTEGIAEYFANSVTDYHHGKGYCESTHSLTDTLLRSGSIPTSYNQRHIAIRFLMEERRPFVDDMLMLMRQGRYHELNAYFVLEAPKAEGAWESWLDAGCGLSSTTTPPEPPPDPDPPAAGSCERSEQVHCFLGQRFEARVDWWKEGAAPTPAYTLDSSTDDSGLFWFLTEQNWEILVKVLDGCDINEHVWVYAASATDLGYLLQVRDTVTGAVSSYDNEPGRPSPAIVDNRAFPESCEAPES